MVTLDVVLVRGDKDGSNENPQTAPLPPIMATRRKPDFNINSNLLVTMVGTSAAALRKTFSVNDD